MTYGLDTSVILRIVTGAPADLAGIVRSRLEELVGDGGEFFVSCLAASEAYFALQRHYLQTKESAIRALRALSEEPDFVFSAEAKAALDTPEAWRASPGFVDRMLAAEYAARGCVTLSCEKSFRRLDLAEVIG